MRTPISEARYNPIEANTRPTSQTPSAIIGREQITVTAETAASSAKVAVCELQDALAVELDLMLIPSARLRQAWIDGLADDDVDGFSARQLWLPSSN